MKRDNKQVADLIVEVSVGKEVGLIRS